MAIRIPPQKTPTDGTLLTSARNVADEWYQPLPPKQGPQWRLWANLPEVELWQAITLSCDIEPKYYLGDADPEFQLRMRIAIGNGLGKGDRPHCALVTLTDVARLARRCGWTLPAEFPGASPLEHAQDPMPPNWDRWLHVPSIELGNAIALSLDIDPQCLSSGRHLIPDTFVTRLQVAIEHLRPGGVLSDFSGEARENSIVVTLQAVARLANFCRWTLPPEFPKPERVPAGADAEPGSEEAAGSDTDLENPPVRPKRQTQADRIKACLAECERRAAEKGLTFDLQNMPGTKADLLDFLHNKDGDNLRSIKGVSSLVRYLKGGVCKWSNSAHANPPATPLYAQLFPELAWAPRAVLKKSTQQRKT